MSYEALYDAYLDSKNMFKVQYSLYKNNLEMTETIQKINEENEAEIKKNIEKYNNNKK